MSNRLILVFSALFSAGCASSTFIDDVNFLRRHTEVVVLMPDMSSDARVAVCPALQGRVITSSAAGLGGLSYGWINRELLASGELRKHINPFGGEDRFWLGPEGGPFSLFFAQGEPQDLAHWQTPAPLDTERMDVQRKSLDSIVLRKRMKLVNASGTSLDLDVQREIRILSGNEPGNLLGIQPDYDVRWVAFQSRNRVTNVGDREWKKETGLPSVWILGMYNPTPESTIVIPFKPGPDEKLGPVVNDTYFGKVPPSRLRIDGGVVYFKGDGQYRSKIGMSPRRSQGVLGSYDAENETLTIVQFHQPKGAVDYVDSSWGMQKEPFSGDAANSYNDGAPAPGEPPLGPFFELESSSPALALKPGHSYTHVHTTFHFQGPLENLDKIAKRVLGVGINRIANAFSP